MRDRIESMRDRFAALIAEINSGVPISVYSEMATVDAMIAAERAAMEGGDD